MRAHKSHEFVSKEATKSSNIARQQQQQQTHALPQNSNSSNFVAEISRAKFNFGFSSTLNKSRATFDLFFANLQGKEREREKESDRAKGKSNFT